MFLLPLLRRVHAAAAASSSASRVLGGLWAAAAAVRDRGGTALNLPDRRSGRSPIDLHLPDTVTDGARRPIAASGDGQTLVYRWDEAGLTLSDWRAVTEPLGRHRTFSAPRGSAIMSRRE